MPVQMLILETLPKDKILEHYERIGLDGKKKEDRIKSFRDWITRQPHLPQTYSKKRLGSVAKRDKFLENYLSRLNNNFELCKERITNLHVQANAHEDYILPGDPLDEDLKEKIMEINTLCGPKLSPEGYRLHFTKFHSKNSESFDLKALVKSFIMQSLILLNEDEFNNGVLFLVNFEGITFQNTLQFTPTALKISASLMQNVFPFRVKGVIYFNVAPIVEKFLSVLKQLFNEKLRNRLVVYSGGVENATKHVPEDCLPYEFGGTGYSLDDVRDQWFGKCEEYRDWFLKKENIIGDKSKTPQELKNTDEMFGLDGSFQKLAVD